jgi:gliding motility-associated-like protein
MKNLALLCLLFIIFSPSSLFSQQLVINEVSQGPSGSKEYVEFLVIPGTGSYQCNNYCIDLRNWIIDDNNGYFSGGPTSGVGIANGAVRFKNDPFWQCIPIGTIILVYNDLDVNSAIPANDFSTTDGNCRLILPISSTYFENQTVSPTTAAMTYPTNGWLPGGLWGPISMANGGDSFQIYAPTNLSTPTHGVSWVNNNINTIIYFSTSATNSVYYFGNTINNNPSNQANWISGTCSSPNNQTPGLPNNAANTSFISSLTNNCAGPLVATLSASVDAGSCQCNGSATVSASGSIPGYSYSWYNASNVSINQSTPTASNLCAGSYYCVVSSFINCTDTVLVTINSTSNSIIPTFSPIAPICAGGTINLPATSTNGISGSWSPAINNTATTTYTFTPDPNQCASSTTLTVQVSNSNTPTFNTISPICAGGTINLPATSTNGISGSWSPAINNTATTTYTFTPDPNQCASSTTLTVQVSNSNTPTFNTISPICIGGTINLPAISTNGISGSWSPAINNTATTTYTFTPDANQCASSTTLTVQVSNSIIPTFNPIAPICAGGTINLPATSTNGISGSWTPAINNTATTTYTFTPDPNQCASSTTLTVQVSNSNTPTFNTISPICAGGTINLPATSTNGISGSWSPAINNTATTTYTFTPDPNQCASSTTLTVQILNAITPTFNQLGPFCEGTIAPNLSNASLEGITGVWGPPGINTGAVGTNTYVFVSNPGQCATNQSMTITVNPNVTPIFSEQEPICFGDNLVLPSLSTNGINGSWSPSFNNTNTTTYTFTSVNGQCAANATMTIEVLSLPPIEAGNNITICLGQSASLSGNGGISYTWSDNVQNGVPFTPANTNVYYLTGSDINGCEAFDSVLITVVPIPNASFSANPSVGMAPLNVSFTNSSSNATFYNWQFGDGSTSVQENSTHIYTNSGEFVVWLITSNGFCQDSVSQLIQVLEPGAPEITVPNVVTPNGDGSNDEWFITTENISELNVIILNRWGNQIAIIQNTADSWDGRTDSGDEVTDGTYFYTYEAKGTKGQYFSGHGFLTLIR